MKRLLLAASAAVFATCLAWAVSSAESMDFHVALGANGAWITGPDEPFPADVEAGGTAWSSLSPHISAVGGVWYGFSHSYIRWQGGARVTTTDVANPNFNTFLGIVYRGGSTSAVKPLEWAPDAGFGWKPSPVKWPNIILTGDASYGQTSHRALAALGVRYVLPLR